MGFPLEINNYTVFRVLSEGEKNPAYDRVKSVFRDYKIFVFILHNPEINNSFDNYLNKNFPILDSASGEHLLFFSTLSKNTPYAYENFRDNRFNLNYLREEKLQFFQNINNFKVRDKDISAYFLSKLLNINFEDLPILIISNSLESKQIYCLKTNERKLLEQLSYLGYLSKIKGDMQIENIAIESFKKYNYNKIILENKLTNYLLLFYSTAVDMKFDQNYLYNDLNINFKSQLYNLKTEVYKLKDSLTGSIPLNERCLKIDNEIEIFNDEFFNKNMIYLLSIALKTYTEIDINLLIPPTTPVKSNLRHYKENRDEKIIIDRVEPENEFSKPGILYSKETIREIDYLNIEEKYLEYESNIILKTHNKIVQSSLGYTVDNEFDMTDFDYSPLILCLTKIFEIEINLSIVHWIRKKLKIHLPEYFNKFEPGIDAKLAINKDKFIVNFNEQKENKWLPPGLGQSEISFKKLMKDFKKSRIFRESSLNSEILIYNWEKIRLLRNKAAHTQLLKENDLIELQEALNRLINFYIFKSLYYMKNKFKGIKSFDN